VINNAHEWLEGAKAGFTDPVELKAIDELLGRPPVVAVPSVINGKVVWLFTGGIYQLAIPLELMPDLTQHAREAGLLDKFLAAFIVEMDELLAGVKQSLEVP
jgi:hypothetical protein